VTFLKSSFFLLAPADEKAFSDLRSVEFNRLIWSFRWVLFILQKSVSIFFFLSYKYLSVVFWIRNSVIGSFSKAWSPNWPGPQLFVHWNINRKIYSVLLIKKIFLFKILKWTSQKWAGVQQRSFCRKNSDSGYNRSEAVLSGERFRKGLSDAAYVTKRLRLTVFIPIV